ncbi:LuxR C-terminal-related transcriptional regulator [Arthrobacter sp. I2-34]|uniref:LuxR C-terminal-related transcriptional regulator n=1 Tax=Arthrobacter hankyongi TaxID=2904801 RepID=A0ABS9L1L4_9MICC|nr:AAA family ATPase [Arthrobacter hankyongi]MCG2620528.1 LuxR C-terminal-related transcriptional regulator [Arthrobacter hankyongi]
MTSTVEATRPGERDPATGLVPAARHRLAVDIAASLSSQGALILGGPGTGKTTLARHVLQLLDGNTHVERVRGGAMVAAIPYGAIHYLLSEVELQVLEHPIHVVAAVARLLRQRAQGRRTVIFIDNAELLDEQAAATLAQLAADATVALLVCAEDTARIPASFAGLRRNGLLARFDLSAFGFAEACEWLDAALAGKVGGYPAHELWTESGGNPLLLGILAGEWTRTGLLYRREGSWCLREEAGRPAPGLDGVRPARLEGLAPGERELAEILALAGSLPMALVRRIGSDADLDELHSRGIVALGSGPTAVAGIPDRLLVELLRSGMPPERSRQLLAAVLGAGGWEVLDTEGDRAGTATLSLARWALEAGAELGANRALSAARAALDAGDAGLALRLAGQAAGGHPASAALLAEAHLALHDAPAAAAALAAAGGAIPQQGGYAAACAPGLPRPGPAPLCGRGAGSEPADGCTALLAAGLSRAGAGGPLDPDLAAAELDLHLGRFRDIPVDRLQALLHAPEPGVRHRAAVLLTQVYGGTGQGAEAERLAGELADRSGPPGSQDSFAMEFAVEAADGLRERFRRQGLWEGYARLLGRQHSRSALRDATLWAYADLAEGLRLADAGEPRSALAVLLRARGQLKSPGGSRLLPLAVAACAYASALLRDPDGVRAHLAAADDQEVCVPWPLRAAARYYAGMARATLGSYAAAAAQLQAEAAAAEANGALAAALRFLFGAARLGASEALPQLAGLAGRVQGPFAQACGSFGAGLQAGDPAELLSAAHVAADDGHAVFAREAARLALALASGCGETAMMRTAQKYIYLDSAGFDFCIGRLGGGQALTVREQEVAGLVAVGRSNLDIAQHFGVSVRTIEGHLYKLYAKLQPKHDPILGGLALEG